MQVVSGLFCWLIIPYNYTVGGGLLDLKGVTEAISGNGGIAGGIAGG